LTALVSEQRKLLHRFTVNLLLKTYSAAATLNLEREGAAKPCSTFFSELQAAHVVVLEKQFADWERRCRQCRECLPEVIPAVQHLWEKSQSSRAAWLTYWGCETGRRIGDLEIALRILQQEEALCLELGKRSSLAYCYRAWGLLAREQRDRKTEREKLAAALVIFTGSKNAMGATRCGWNWRKRQQLTEQPKNSARAKACRSTPLTSEIDFGPGSLAGLWLQGILSRFPG
jgi:hypothetical protein